jgi:hypothetical protein
MLALDQTPTRAEHSKLEEYESRDEIWQLLEDCWKRRPEDRPTAKDLVQRLTDILSRSKGGVGPSRLSDPPISSTMVCASAWDPFPEAYFYLFPIYSQLQKSFDSFLAMAARILLRI